MGEGVGKPDFGGISLIAVLTIATLFAVDALSPLSLVWLAGAAIALVLYVRHARRRKAPVVRLEHIVPQPYRGLALSTSLMLTGTFAMSSYIPLYVRAGRAGSAALTAWSVLPLTVGWTVGATLASRLADRHSESWIVVLGFIINILFATRGMGARLGWRTGTRHIPGLLRCRNWGWNDHQRCFDSVACGLGIVTDGGG